jgi:hypothetical protein
VNHGNEQGVGKVVVFGREHPFVVDGQDSGKDVPAMFNILQLSVMVVAIDGRTNPP